MTSDLPTSLGHPFYAPLNATLAGAGFDRFAEERCRAFYAPVTGRPGLLQGAESGARRVRPKRPSPPRAKSEYASAAPVELAGIVTQKRGHSNQTMIDLEAVASAVLHRRARARAPRPDGYAGGAGAGLRHSPERARSSQEAQPPRGRGEYVELS